MALKILNNDPIKLGNLVVSSNQLLCATENTNKKIREVGLSHDGINLFDIIDFRVFSGMIGELFAKELSVIHGKLLKNPNLNGYPDLLNVYETEYLNHFNTCIQRDFLSFKYGGLEVKNSFGTKKAKSNVVNGNQRIVFINSKIDWKAHHQETNNLIGLLSDYIDGVPQIVALCYSDKLGKEDWNNVQTPKKESAMTSFTTITQGGFRKMKNNIKLCYDDITYLNFFN
jgi:hypothetical protein